MESVRSRIHDDAKVIQVHYVIWIIGQHQTGGAWCDLGFRVVVDV